MRFRLLAGEHIQEDPTAKPDPETGRRPPRTYKVGQVVESDTDLVEKFGPTKFERLGDTPRSRAAKRRAEVGEEVPSQYAAEETSIGPRLPSDPVPEIAKKSPSVAPGGQVSTGQPVAAEDSEGHARQAPADEEDFEEAPTAEVPEEEDDEEEYEDDDEDDGEVGEEVEEEPVKTSKKVQLPPNFDRMTAAQLKDFAKDQKIDLGGATKVEDMRSKIRARSTKSSK